MVPRTNIDRTNITVFRDSTLASACSYPGWLRLKAPDGSIIGVYSQSDRTPIKAANFRPEDVDFEEIARYSDWRFVFRAGSGALPAPLQSAPKPK